MVMYFGDDTIVMLFCLFVRIGAGADELGVCDVFCWRCSWQQSSLLMRLIYFGGVVADVFCGGVAVFLGF